MSVLLMHLDKHSLVCCRTGMSNKDSRKSCSLPVCPAAVIGWVLSGEGKSMYS